MPYHSMCANGHNYHSMIDVTLYRLLVGDSLLPRRSKGETTPGHTGFCSTKVNSGLKQNC